MKLDAYFRHFLAETVNLNDSRIDSLDARVATITKFLTEHEDLGPLVLDITPQGSYAQKTIIRPRPGRDFDADVLVHLEYEPSWEPKDYLHALYRAFRSSSTYSEMVSRKTRCVTVQYAGEFHIDVVPLLKRANSLYITNKHANRFELTNPEGFNEWLDQQNRSAGGHLVEVIRLVKYLRDTKGTFAIKSVILTTLLGDRVNEMNLWNDPNYYSDLPTALYNIVRDLDQELQATPQMPRIADPSCPSEDFNHRWDQDGYANFREKIHYYAHKITLAYEEQDRATSIGLWQQVFGPEFKAPPVRKAASDEDLAAAETEKFIDRDYGFAFTQTRYQLQIRGRVLPKKGFRPKQLSGGGNRVEKKRNLAVTITRCTVPKPYDVYWKIKNTGDEARAAGQLRGEIHRDEGARERREPTAFRGSHYVECYIVKDGKCVARARQPVFVV